MNNQRLSTTCICQICGNAFHPFRASKGIFCSNKCKFIAKKSPITIKCVGCGISFTKSTHKDGKYCTHECYRSTKLNRTGMERLTPFINKTDFCWLWTGGHTRLGYGRLFFQGRFVMAHRLMYQLTTGEDITNKVIRHYVCDNPPCVNPDHLRSGTKHENSLDAVSKGRHAHGEKASYSKLTEDAVRAIRADGRIHKLIAADYGISRRTVGHIKSRAIWKHVL